MSDQTTAENLEPGQMFHLFKKLCTIVEVDANDFEMIVVRFVMDEDNSPELNVLIVPLETPITLHLLS